MKKHLFSTFLLLAAQNAWGELIRSEASALKSAYPKAVSFSAEDRSFNDAEIRELAAALGKAPFSRRCKLITPWGEGQEPLGLAVVDDELGKHQPMTYLVAMDREGRVISLDLLFYREPRGGEVRSPRFLSQFKGKGGEDPLRVGKDIDAVSGATISSRSLSLGARKALWVWSQKIKPRERKVKP